MIEHMEPEKYKQLVYRPKHLSIDDIQSGCITLYGEANEETKLCMMQEEFRQSIDVLKSYSPSVTFYGSARLKEDTAGYQSAQKLAYRISKELGYAVLSGGGGGIMEAANRGAFEAGGKSVGLTIRLPHEEHVNKYVNDVIPFYYFFTRKVSMSYTTNACLFFPGGFGTFDELFGMLTLRQTNKIGPVPIILVGKDYWEPLQKVIQEVLIDKYGTVSEEELNIYTITDNENEILDIIKNSKPRSGADSL